MNKYQKETIKMSLEEEKKVLNSLTSEYKEAKKAVKSKLKTLMEREDSELPHVIHQIKYQKAIESQIDEALEKLKKGEYKTIADYMEDSYGTGFTSSLYRLQKQGVPLLFPMDRNEILKAVQTNSKISGGLYKRLGINTRAMKNAIRQEITRGISSSMSYGDIARNLDSRMNSGLYNSYRIARTEGHRINQEASYDAMSKAKEAGADIVKQWDSTLDGRTRPHHRDLNGQIRELDDPFEVAGLSAMYPSGFGKASEDINCRCVVLEIGRWELDEEDTFTKFDGDEGVIVSDLSNTTNINTFKVGYYDKLIKNETEIINQMNLNKPYSGIWKDDVTIKDYPAKKGAIQAKKDYFNEQIAKGNKVTQFQKALDDLDDFEKQGKIYESHKLNLDTWKTKLKETKAKLPKVDSDIIDDAFSEERKNNAYWFKVKKDADNVLRDKAGEVWRNSSELAKDAGYDYTTGSGRYNRPLAGFEKPYHESGSGWEPKYYKGYGQVYIDYEGVGDKIRALTDMIDDSDYDFDIWLQHGCNYSTVNTMFGLPYTKDITKLTEKELEGYIGKDFILGNFLSTSPVKGGGFSSQPVIVNVYAPTGSKMMYAEPFSAFGNGDGRYWDGLSKQSSFGSEFEVILQRGGHYTITKIEKNGGRMYIDVELHPEEGYDLFQQDPNEWKGSTKKGR